MKDTKIDFMKIMENQLIGITIMTRSGICREYKILEVEENHVRAYNRITSKEEHINLENIKGVYVNITRM